MLETERELSVYTDGAYSAKTGVGGWAWWYRGPDGPVHDSSWAAPTTNNAMELQAAIAVLAADPGHSPLRIVSDSAYVVRCFTERWYDGWRRRGWHNWTGDPVANRDLWEELLAQLEAHRAPVRWAHVRGHGRRASDAAVDVAGNAAADRLAVAARERGQRFVAAAFAR